MSVSLSAYSLNKVPTIKEFKTFLKEKVKESLKKEYHDLQFKRDGNKSLWVGCKGHWKRGCLFSFGNNSVCGTASYGSSESDWDLQSVGISELVKKYKGEIINDDFSVSWSFNKDINDWEEIRIEYSNPTE